MRCYCKKSKIHCLGLKRDMSNRVIKIRIDTPAIQRLIEISRGWIFEKGLGVQSTAVKNKLDPISLLPIRVCLINSYMASCSITESINRVHSQSGSQYLVSTITLSSHPTLCTSLSWEYGKPFSFISYAY